LTTDSTTDRVLLEHAPIVRFPLAAPTSASSQSADPWGTPAHHGVLRVPTGVDRPATVLCLHGGLEPLPLETLEHLAKRSILANALLRAGFAVAYSTRRALPEDPHVSSRGLGAVADIRQAVHALRVRTDIDAQRLALLGSSGGSDLAFEVAGIVGPRALVVEEPATVLLARILEPDTPKAGATWTPTEVWPKGLVRAYSGWRRQHMRALLRAVACPIFLPRGDQPLLDADPQRAIREILLPELEHLGKQVEERVYPGRAHGFGFLAGASPEPVSAEAADSVAQLLKDIVRFLKPLCSEA